MAPILSRSGASGKAGAVQQKDYRKVARGFYKE
jgi:hypothetical protein